MTRSSAEHYVVASAIVVGGTHAYVRWVKHQPTVQGETSFWTAWAVIYFVLALMSTGAPGLAAAFSMLVAAADLLENMPSLASALHSAEIPQTIGQGQPSSSSSSPAPAPAQPSPPTRRSHK